LQGIVVFLKKVWRLFSKGRKVLSPAAMKLSAAQPRRGTLLLCKSFALAIFYFSAQQLIFAALWQK
jgi:hypothetical protein